MTRRFLTVSRASQTAMTRAELITSIGEVLLHLDNLRKDQLLDEDSRVAVNRVRSALAKQQMLLAIGGFQENPAVFTAAAKRVEAISAELQRAMDHSGLGNIPVNILERLVLAVDSLISSTLRL